MNNLLKLCFKTRLCVPICSFPLYKTPICRLLNQTSLDVNTHVIKDVILYKSDNDKFFRVITYFGLVQFGFWSYLASTAFQTLKDIPVDPTQETVWWKKINLGESKWRNSLTIISFFIGWGILSISWLYTLRAVKYLILRKGGKQATIVTYAPFGRNRMFTLDLKNISSMQARTADISFIPIKVKGHMFYYMIDMNGEFKNPTLFDNTAGLKRVWSLYKYCFI